MFPWSSWTSTAAAWDAGGHAELPAPFSRGEQLRLRWRDVLCVCGACHSCCLGRDNYCQPSLLFMGNVIWEILLTWDCHCHILSCVCGKWTVPFITELDGCQPSFGWWKMSNSSSFGCSQVIWSVMITRPRLRIVSDAGWREDTPVRPVGRRTAVTW